MVMAPLIVNKIKMLIHIISLFILSIFAECVTEETCHEIHLNADYWKDNVYDSYTDADFIVNRLYLGNVCAAHNKSWLDEHHITLVISVAREWPSYTCSLVGNITQVNYALDDTVLENEDKVIATLRHSTHIIKTHLEKNDGNILIHCNMGISRSTTVLIHYLQYKWPDKSFQRLLGIVKARRPVAKPNNLFSHILITHREEL